jgi:hypothetical protein
MQQDLIMLLMPDRHSCTYESLRSSICSINLCLWHCHRAVWHKVLGLLLMRRLQLHPAFLDRQQALLQARLLHMLLPLQQAPPPAAAAAAAPQQQQPSSASPSAHARNQPVNLLRKKFQRHRHKPLAPPQQVSNCAVTSPGLDPAVLVEVLRRVQGFVSGLADARLEQQQQVLPQLQQQLQQLAAAVKQPAAGMDVQHHTTSASSSSSSSSDATTATQVSSSSSSSDADVSVMLLQPQLLTVPSLGELLGFGNLQQLLLLEQQHLQQQLLLQQGSTDVQQQQQQQLCELLAAVPAGEELPWQHPQMCSACLQQLVPPERWMDCWKARADGAADDEQPAAPSVPDADQMKGMPGNAPHTCSSAAAPVGNINEWIWEQQRLQQLLQLLGYSAEEARHAVKVCVDLQLVLETLEEAGAAAAGRAPHQAFWTLVKTPTANSSDSSSSSSSSSSSAAHVLPSFVLRQEQQPSLDSVQALLQAAGRSVALGPLAWCGIATLLVRAALMRLAGNGQREVSASMGAAAGSGPDTSWAASSSSSREAEAGFQTTAAAAAAGRGAPSKKQLREELAMRLRLLRKLLVLLQRTQQLAKHATKQCQDADVASCDAYPASWQLTAQQQHQLLQQLLQETLQLPAEQSWQVAEDLTTRCSQQRMLTQLIADCFGLYFHTAYAPAVCDAGDDAADLTSDALQKWAAATSELVGAFWGQAVSSTLMPCMLQQPELRPLLLHHFMKWSGDDASSSSSSSCCREETIALERALARAVAAPATSAAAAAADDHEAAAAAASPAADHAGSFILLRGVDVTNAQLLLQTLETALCGSCNRMLVMLQQLPHMQRHLAVAPTNAAAIQKGTAEFEQMLCNRRLTSHQWLQQYHTNKQSIKLHARLLGKFLGVLGDTGLLLSLINNGIHSMTSVGTAGVHLAWMLGEQAEFAGMLAAAEQDDVQQQQQGGFEAAADRQYSSRITDQAGSMPSSTTHELPQAAAPAAAAASEAVAQRLQMLQCAGLLTYNAWQLTHQKSDFIGDAAAALHAATTAAGAALATTALPELPAEAAAPAEIAAVQAQVRQVLRGYRTACAELQGALFKLDITDLATSVSNRLRPAVAALGLELLSRMGMWTVPDMPPKPADLESDASQQPAHSSSSSSRGAPAKSAGVFCDGQDALKSWMDGSGVKHRVQVLQGVVCELRQEDVSNLQVLLDGVSNGGYSSSSSSSGSAAAGAATRVPAAGSSSTSCRGFACDRLAQLMQLQEAARLRQTQQAAAGAAAAAPFRARPPELWLCHVLEALQAQKDGSSGIDAASEEQKRLQSSMADAAWRLLLATKPTTARALHCASLPAACRSYKAFAQAVLGWPPQQEAAAEAQQQQQQQDECKTSIHSRGRCGCGKEGHAYTLPASGPFSMLVQGSNQSVDIHRAVCADPACVARELQQLAQQGLPAVLGELGVSLAFDANNGHEGLLLLPTEYRCASWGCHTCFLAQLLLLVVASEQHVLLHAAMCYNGCLKSLCKSCCDGCCDLLQPLHRVRHYWLAHACRTFHHTAVPSVNVLLLVDCVLQALGEAEV